MKTLLALLLLIPSLSWGESIIYQCKYLKSYTATFDYPQNIIAIVDFNEGKLEKYIEDGNNLTGAYHCVDCVSMSNRVNIWTKKYDPWSLSPIDTENARVFEIYAEDLVAHLWKPTQSGYDYQCQRF